MLCLCVSAKSNPTMSAFLDGRLLNKTLKRVRHVGKTTKSENIISRQHINFPFFPIIRRWKENTTCVLYFAHNVLYLEFDWNLILKFLYVNFYFNLIFHVGSVKTRSRWSEGVDIMCTFNFQLLNLFPDLSSHSYSHKVGYIRQGENRCLKYLIGTIWKHDRSHHEDIAGAVGDVNMGGFCLLLVAVHHTELRHLNKQSIKNLNKYLIKYRNKQLIKNLNKQLIRNLKALTQVRTNKQRDRSYMSSMCLVKHLKLFKQDILRLHH